MRLTAVGGAFLIHPVDARRAEPRQRESKLVSVPPAAIDGAPELPAAKPRRRPWLRYLAGSCAALGLLFALLVALARTASPAARFTLKPVETRDLETTVDALGTLEVVTAIDVGAEVTGRVERVLVEENAGVHKGQLLAVIDTQELAAAVAEARAQVASALAAVELAEATVNESRFSLPRMEGLARFGVASQQDLDSTRASAARGKASLSSARAAAALARAGLAAAQSRLAKANIVAPIDGIVLSRLVEPGQTLNAGFQTPILFRVAPDLAKLRLRVNVDEADVARLEAGQTASFEVAAFPGRTFSSRVVRIAKESRALGNVVVFVATLEVDNTELLLRPGMTCTTKIVTARHPGALAVPNAALRSASPEAQAAASAPSSPSATPFKANAEVWISYQGRATAIPVATGIANRDYTEIVAGDLRMEDQVIIDTEGT